MIPRRLEKVLEADASRYPVITLTGPRQSGKTTLSRATFPEHEYVSLEDPELRRLATDDPRGFLERFRGRCILDEVQRVPDLFSYIQVIVDEEQEPGRFVLTGSQNFLLLRSISQSLAGRCAVRHLLPFSFDELQGWPAFPLDELGRSLPEAREQPPGKVMTHLFTGGFPRIHDKALPPQDWLRNYHQTYLERDVRDVLNVGDLESFGRFLSLVAGRSGQLLNLSQLASDCGVSHTTAKRWLSVLEASFVVLLLRPHTRNFNKRLIRAPKLYLLDTGLLCHLLRIRTPDDLFLHASRGAIFETFVVTELYKRALHAGREPDLYFWRDSRGHEIDVLLDQGANRQVPVEVKSGKTVAPDAFRGLDYWRRLAGDERGPAALVHAGDRAYRHKGVCVYPWWNF